MDNANNYSVAEGTVYVIRFNIRENRIIKTTWAQFYPHRESDIDFDINSIPCELMEALVDSVFYTHIDQTCRNNDIYKEVSAHTGNLLSLYDFEFSKCCNPGYWQLKLTRTKTPISIIPTTSTTNNKVIYHYKK